MKILAAKALSDFRLHLTFSDGTDGIIDLSDLAGRGVFAAWLKPGMFEKVAITSYGAVEWPGELNLCPDTLYMKLVGKQPEDVFPVLRRELADA